jgi:hypothetical protein
VYKRQRYRGSDTPSQLDLILTSEELMIESVDYFAPLGSSDHVVLNFRYVTYANIMKNEEHKTRMLYLTADPSP